jgi:hypothetical protein
MENKEKLKFTLVKNVTEFLFLLRSSSIWLFLYQLGLFKILVESKFYGSPVLITVLFNFYSFKND